MGHNGRGGRGEVESRALRGKGSGRRNEGGREPRFDAVIGNGKGGRGQTREQLFEALITKGFPQLQPVGSTNLRSTVPQGHKLKVLS